MVAVALDLPMSESAELILRSLQRYLADHSRPGWIGLANELGLMGVGIPEIAGGSGGGGIERAVIMAELGPVLAGAEWLGHHLGASLVARLAPGHALLPSLAAGAAQIAVALGDGPDFALVAGAAAADWFVISGSAQVRLIAASSAGVARRRRAMLDGTDCADFSLVPVAGLGTVLAAGEIATAAQRWTRAAQHAGRCAEASGLMGRMLADTAAYLQQREQFGVTIAQFQVLRHRFADMHMAAMKAAALTERAILAEAGNPLAWDRAVSAAVVETIEAVRIVGEGAVQCHGAMGLTEELALGGQYKRAMAISAGLGPIGDHLARHAELAG